MSRRPGVWTSRRKAIVGLATWSTLGLVVYVALILFVGFLWHEADQAGRQISVAASVSVKP